MNKTLSDLTDDKVKAGAPITREIVYTGMFAAVLAVMTQISVPMPSGVPITLQTFAVALTGYVLAWKRGTLSTVVYILIGAIGLPVFSGFKGGVQVLVAHTGGFIWGFLVFALLCGVGTAIKNKAASILLGMTGLSICHLFGVVQFMLVTKNGFLESFLLVSAPYLIKDIVSVILAYILGSRIRASLLKAGLM